MSFDVINLEGLPAPEALETYSFDELFAQWKADYKVHYDAMVAASDEDHPDYDTLMLETDPVCLAMRTGATREMRMRARVNDAIKAVMLRFSFGSNLDNLAAYHSVKRLDGESDTRLKVRISLAPGAFSVAGPLDAYRYFAMTVAPEAVHVHAYRAGSGDSERIVVLPLTIDGNVSDETLEKIHDSLDDETVVPATDVVEVRRPDIIRYGIEANLLVGYGADRTLVADQARSALINHEASLRKVAANIYRSGQIAALKIEPVLNVTLQAPQTDIIVDDNTAAILDPDLINITLDEVPL